MTYSNSKTVCFSGLIVVLLLLPQNASGQFFSKLWKKPNPIPILFQQTPNQQQLLNALNSRYQSVRQLSSSISVSIDGMPTKIKGTLQVEFPDRMRLKAGVMGVSEFGIDVGSNENDFWIWSKAALPGQPPAFYFANHQAFKQSSIHQQLPLDPKQLVDALGLVAFAPNQEHRGPAVNADGRLQLVTVTQTHSGNQYRSTLINAATGLIEQQAIYSANMARIAWSNSVDYRNYPIGQTGNSISLPQRVEIHMDMKDQAGKIQTQKITVDLGTFSIDSLYGDPRKMWEMPDGGRTQKINLAQVSIPGTPPSQLQPPTHNPGGSNTRQWQRETPPPTGYRPAGYGK